MVDVTIRPLDLERDAARIADMWNASDLQWPSTWSRGVPFTAEIVREQLQEQRLVIVYVAEVDGLIAGYCSFMEGGFMGREGEGYLHVLNVRPEYQGLSVGRRLIQATIDYSVRHGWQRQTLGTWAANFRAVPTYKKTGHFWAPDTSAFMHNFIPGALQMSLARPFFDRHDWYASYLPTLTQGEDDDRWEGLKVYRQHWEADGDTLTIWIDREARAPVAIETNELFLASIPEQIEPLAGSAVPLRWRVANRRSQPLRVCLSASGDAGLAIDHHDSFTVAPGETIERTANVHVAEDASRDKPDGAAPAVRTILQLDEGAPCAQQLVLYAGLRPRKPLMLDTRPARAALCPGRVGSIDLQLHSSLDEPMRAMVLLIPPPGVTVERAPQHVEIAPRGHVSLPVTLEADAQALYRLPVVVQWSNSGGEHTLRETLPLPSLAPGGLLAYRHDDTVTLETESLCVVAHALEGAITVEDKRRRAAVASLGPLLGPPFFPSDTSRVSFELDLQQRDGCPIVHMVGQCKSPHGLTLHQTVGLSAGGLLTLSEEFENRSLETQATRFCLAVRGATRDRERITLPLQTGAVQAPASAYPLPWNDAPRDAAAYAEPWMAWEREGTATAVAWSGVDRVAANAYQAGLHGPQASLAPGQRLPGPCYAFYAGAGDWRQARRALAYWAGLPAELPAALQPHPRTRAHIEPRVVVTTSDRAEATLHIDAGSIRASDGRVLLEMDGRVSVDPQEVPFRALRRGDPRARAVRFALPARQVGAFAGWARLEATLNDSSEDFAIVRLGTEATVNVSRTEVSGQQVWEIDNGLSLFRVAPAFGPSVVAWEVAGANQLASAFPVAQGLSFNYPWFGGICPQLYPMGMMRAGGYLYRESFGAQELAFQDRAGLPWRGVSLSVRPAHEQLHDLRLDIEYATMGESNVLRVAHRLHNLRHTEQVVQLASYVFAGLGGQPSELVLRGPDMVHRPNPVLTFVHDQPWGALVRQDSGRCLLMVGQRGGVSLMDWGQDGRSLGSAHEVRLAGDEVREHVYYLALTDSFQDAEGYIMLRDFPG
jgi:GNAT superfamily N-acetyltransferase